nr:hypothetical protein [Tanacetum cinerariifolium]
MIGTWTHYLILTSFESSFDDEDYSIDNNSKGDLNDEADGSHDKDETDDDAGNDADSFDDCDTRTNLNSKFKVNRIWIMLFSNQNHHCRTYYCTRYISPWNLVMPEGSHLEFPGIEDTIVDFLEGQISMYTKFFEFAKFHMDLFNLISVPNHTKVKTGLRLCTTHEVPLLTAIMNRVIDMEDPDVATESSGTPSTIKKAIPEVGVEDEITVIGPLLSKKRRKRGDDGADRNAPPKMLRKDHAASRPTQSTIGGKSLTSTRLEASSTFFAPAPQETPVDVSDPDPLSYVTSPSIPERYISQPSFPFIINADLLREPPSRGIQILRSIPLLLPLLVARQYISAWVVCNQRLPPGFLGCMPGRQYNMNLARQVAMGSQLRLSFKQEARLQKRATKKIAKQEQRIQVRKEEIKKLDQEIQGFQNQMSNLKTNTEVLRPPREQQSADSASSDSPNLSHRRRTDKSCFRGVQKNEDYRVEKRCRLWVVDRLLGHGLRLVVMKCAELIELRQAFANVMFAGFAKGMSEGLTHDIEHRKASQDMEVVEAYDPEANIKYLQALQELKDLKYPIVDQVEVLKDAAVEAVKEEMLLEDSFEANVSRVKKKKKCRVVCRTHGVGFAHHARSDGVPVSVPIVAPQGLAILLVDAATQTETSKDDASLKLLRSKSLLPMYNLDWP